MTGRHATLNQLNVIAGDMPASIGFYRRLGVQISEPAEPAPFHVNGTAGDGFRLEFDSPEFAQVWNKSWAGRTDVKGRIVIGFRVDSREAVDRTYGQMTAAGHKGLVEPFDAFWGARYAIIEDPNGIAVGLMSPIDPSRRSQPPEPFAGGG
jgi:catechol 2,3-dioxygenase-like lactoylglutathione lyase family enzyme